MNASLKALAALFAQYDAGQSPALIRELEEITVSQDPFLDRLKKFDAAIEKYPTVAPIQEYAFDLFMCYHLDEKNEQDDYFESEEWRNIEDKTLDRGTELLNILLYINESENSEVDISIEDFLYEFLLVDEDEFQDEHRIYEDIIVNQELVEESIDSILSVSTRIDHTSEIFDLFVPLMLFFKEPDEKLISREVYNKLKPLDRALLATMLAYHNS